MSPKAAPPKKYRVESGSRATRVLVALAIVATVSAVLVTAKFVEPAPPTEVSIAAGPKDGAYYHYALRYKEEIERYGVEVNVLETNGSLENCQRIRAGLGSTVGFVQGGAVTAEKWPELTLLCSTYYEPLWVFYREESFGESLRVLRQLAGRAVAIGAKGSGTQAVASALLRENGILPPEPADDGDRDSDGHSDASRDRRSRPPVRGRTLDTAASVESLLAGDVDAIFVVSGPNAPVIRRLLSDPTVELMSFQRHLAYVRKPHLSYLKPVKLAEGMVDLAAELPKRDVTLLAPTAALVAHAGDSADGGVHPAIVELFIRASKKIFSNGQLLEERDEFPNDVWTKDFPVDETAERALKTGDSLLSRILPFRLVNWLRRFKVLLLPLLTIGIPLIRIVPKIMRWRFNRRIYSWYRVLQRAEEDVEGPETAPAALRAALAGLQQLNQEVADIRVPLSYMKDLYGLRLHVTMVTNELRDRLGLPSVSAPPRPEVV